MLIHVVTPSKERFAEFKKLHHSSKIIEFKHTYDVMGTRGLFSNGFILLEDAWEIDEIDSIIWNINIRISTKKNYDFIKSDIYPKLKET